MPARRVTPREGAPGQRSLLPSRRGKCDAILSLQPSKGGSAKAAMPASND